MRRKPAYLFPKENDILYPLDYVEQISKIELALTQLNAERSLVPTPRQLEIHQIGQSTLLRDPTDPAAMYFNRVKGFGSHDIANLDAIFAHYPDSPPCFDLTPDQLTEDVARALSDRGYIPVDQLVFLAAERAGANWREEASGYPIERVTEASAEEFIHWIKLTRDSMEIDGDMIARCKGYFHRPDFINYMLRIDGSPAAMGSLFLHGGAGYIANDYTFLEFRGRGCQKALLMRRLHDAAGLGAENVYTDVVFGSASHANMEKAGFRTAFLNTFWIKK
ncbi:hypothetical protein COLU111180_14150 [Cohnella lubricantis]|uniref:N-acetyltransferase domain-containing protein n=1 Tax=Cohnella lubricantis TaxID=2163172 RepID=A0A841TCM7_9BACL|nr:hypothetical protein [Cohnella lubricantis]MBB6677765.1 hypothetical protein [Cohnella lubricantis]MBP2118089.1 hypothetical protein [Cohnella lubricantis]